MTTRRDFLSYGAITGVALFSPALLAKAMKPRPVEGAGHGFDDDDFFWDVERFDFFFEGQSAVVEGKTKIKFANIKKGDIFRLVHPTNSKVPGFQPGDPETDWMVAMEDASRGPDAPYHGLQAEPWKPTTVFDGKFVSLER